MPSRRAATDPGRRSPTSTMIGFRLDDASYRALAERAASEGVSVHEMARTCVVEGLHEENETAQMAVGLASIYQALVKLRGDVATSAEALLINAGGVKPEQAHRWVVDHFK